jgi:putative ABC transport system permease protein
MSGGPGPGLWWRWSWRDLRRRWLSVLAIALVIAIGTGVYAGLGSTATWRRLSNDASYQLTGMHDLRVQLSPGTTASTGDLLALLDDPDVAPVAGPGIGVATERLVVPTQVDITADPATGQRGALVRGQLVGADLVPASNGRGVDMVVVDRGQLPEAAQSEPEVLLEQKFADYYDLPDAGTATLAGGTQVTWTGTGVGPEAFFIVTDGQPTAFAESGFAVVYTSLADAQRLAGLAGQVNELVLRLDADADDARRDAISNALTDALGAAGLGGTVTTRDDDPAYRLLYDDIEGDQKVWTAISVLVLAAAAIAAFNLVGRVVDTQRREIGVQMAIGVAPSVILRRPVTMAAQIALLGTMLGVVLGVWVGSAMRGLMEDFLPLPVWSTPFQFGTFAWAALLGFAVPFAASVLPVRRVLRLEPIEAIRNQYGARGGWRAGQHAHRVRDASRRPHNSLARLPLRNTLRNLRRSLLTAAGVGVAVATLVAVLGMLDSFVTTIERGEQDLERVAPDRVDVRLTTFLDVAGDEVAGVAALDGVAAVHPRLELPAQLWRDADSADDEAIPVLLEVLELTDDPEDPTRWTPTLSPASGVDPSDVEAAAPRIVLARKAADDLGVSTGDRVMVRHVAAASDGTFGIVDTVFVVGGLHVSPLRSLAYVDPGDAGVFGLDGATNALSVVPNEATSADDLRRALFPLPGVGSVQPLGDLTGQLSEALGQFVSFLVLAAGAVLALAVLIAFNSSAIAADERTREHATLFAFGLRVRTVLRMMMQEGVLVGLVATVFGIALGYLLVQWMVGSVVASTLPDVGFEVVVSPTPLIAALAVGVGAVGLAPVLVIRRLVRMDIPDALRVME